MGVLLVELLGFIPARFSADIGSKTGYRYGRTGALEWRSQTHENVG